MSKMTSCMAALLLALSVLHLSAQERQDTVSVPESVAAFDLPWIAKCYGFDWRYPDSPVAGEADDDSAFPDDFSGAKDVVPSETAVSSDSYTISLRANLLRWATLTPDLGLEWRISPSVGIMVNGSWTSWMTTPAAMPSGK